MSDPNNTTAAGSKAPESAAVVKTSKTAKATPKKPAAKETPVSAAPAKENPPAPKTENQPTNEPEPIDHFLDTFGWGAK